MSEKRELPVVKDRETIQRERYAIPRTGPAMEISREYRLEVAHRLPHLPPDHKCSRLHGHSIRVEVAVRGQCDAMLGWVCDFGRIDVAWGTLIHDAADHRYLNEIEGLQNPTSENLAQWIWQRLSVHFAGEVELARVTVRETCVSSATYRGATP